MQSMTWYEVDATGMHELYPEVCNEDIIYPLHTFRVRASYGVGRHSIRQLHGHFLRPQTTDE